MIDLSDYDRKMAEWLAEPQESKYLPFDNLHDLACHAERVDGRGLTVRAFLDRLNAEIDKLQLKRIHGHFDVLGDEDNGDEIIPSGTDRFIAYAMQDEEGWWCGIYSVFMGSNDQWNSQRIGISRPLDDLWHSMALTAVTTKLIGNQ